MSNNSNRSYACELPDLYPVLPSEYKRGEANMEKKVGGNSTMEVPGTRVTKPRH